MIALWLALGSELAVAAPDAVLEEHQALYRRAREAETARDFDEAVRACTEAIALLPTGPRATTCSARLDWLALRRDADGSFASLVALQDVRTEYRSLDPDEAVRRVTALRERPGIAEIVDVDAGLWLARDALERRADPAAALALTEPLIANHHGPLRKSLVGLHALALAGLGREDEALSAEDEIRVAPPGVRRTPVEEVVLARRVRAATWASGGVLAGFALVALPLAVRGRAERFRPWGLVPIAVATVGAGLIADRWAEGAGAAAPWMFLGFAAVHLVAGPARRRADGPLKQVVTGLAALATAAVATLALIGTDTLAWVLP